MRKKLPLITFGLLFALCFGPFTLKLDAQCVPRSGAYFGEIIPNGGCGVWTENLGNFGSFNYFRMPALLGAQYAIATCGSPYDTQLTGFEGAITATSIFYNDDNGPWCTGTSASVTYTATFNDYIRAEVRQFNCATTVGLLGSMKVKQLNNLVFTSSSTNMCQSETRTLTATPAATTPFTALAGDGGTFSGTGVSGINFNSPIPAGNSQTYTITYTFGYCSQTQDILVYHAPTTANAGVNQTVCSSSATMAGNAPSFGTGTWSVVSGSGTITSPNSPTTTITNLGVGANVFRWQITNGPCSPSSSTVTITRDQTPTPSAAGPDQTVCATTATLAGNGPAVGTGMWTLVGGSGTITSPTSPSSGVTALGVGANTFRWTISNGVCTPSTDDVVITRDANPTTANAGPDQTVCGTTATLAGNSAAVGSGMWTLVGGTGTITTPSSPNSGLTGLGAGTNTFRWTISNGVCPASTDDVVITVDLPPTAANAGPDQTICATTATLAGNTPAVGSGMWTLIGGAGTITTPTSPTSGLTGLGTGTNTFRWTITNGSCTASTDDVVITVDAPPSTANAGPDQNVCGTTATLAGNTPGVGSGMWSVVSGAATITSPTSANSGVTGLGTGANTLRWTISNGVCTPSTDDVIITVDLPPSASNAGPDQSVCATTATLAGNTPVTGTGTWTLASGAGTITSASSPNSGVTALGVGANAFVWTISNGSCPSTSDTVIITREPFPTTSNAGPDQNVCGSTATLAGNTPTTGTGMWTLVGGTGTITTPTSPTSGVTGLAAGPNTFRWTISSGSCTPSTDDVVITVDLPPSAANAGLDQTVCATSTNLNGNIPAVGSGTWTTTGGATIASPTSGNSLVTNLAVGANTFIWTISNGSCPANSDTVIVTRDDFPTTSNAGADTTICDTTWTLAGNPAVVGSGTWTIVSGQGTFTNANSATSQVTNVGIGSNTYRWTISNGVCTSSTDDVIITRIAYPTTADAGADQGVCDSTATLNGNNPAVGTGTWSLASGTGTISNPANFNSGVSGLSVGANAFVWTISNGNCTPSTDTVIITRNALPTATVSGNTSICFGNSTTLTAASGASSPAFEWWDAPTGGNSLGTSASYTTPGLTSNASYWAEVTDGVTGCTSNRLQVDVTVNPLPTVSVGPDSAICPGDTVCIDAGAGFTTYSWSTGATTQVICVSAAGTYTCTVTDSNNCANSDSMTVTLNTPPAPSLGADTTICTGDSLCLDGGPGASWNWSTGDTTQTICVTAAGTYSVTTTDANGCSGTDEVVVSLGAAPVADFTFDDSGCPVVNFTDASSDANTYSWNFGDGNTSTSQNPSNDYTAAGDGNYTVTLTVTGPCGTNSTSQTIVIDCLSAVGDELAQHITIYPNPTNGHFTVDFSQVFGENVEINVFDLRGVEVYSNSMVNANGDFRQEIELTDVAKGTYFVRVNVDGASMTKKLVVY